jgi:hypothetical protein
MVATGLDINRVLRQHSPLEAQLQATLKISPALARHSFSRKRMRIDMPSIFSYPICMLISSGKTEVIYGNE